VNRWNASLAALAFSLLVAPAGRAAEIPADSAGNPPPARLIITADTDSATVYLDGSVAGITPLTLDSVAAGTHVLLVVSRNPASWYRKIDSISIALIAGESRHLRFSVLSPLRLSPAALPAVSPLLQGNGGQNGRTFAILATGGVTVAAGIAAAYYKITADDRNEAYLATGNQALLDERRRLDTAAGIAFAAMEVGFAVFTYLLMAE